MATLLYMFEDAYAPLPVMAPGWITEDGVQLIVSRDSHNVPSAAMLPARAGRLSSDAVALLGDIEHQALAIRSAQADLFDTVVAARTTGVSWSLIAWATGLTTEGARKRFTEPD